jgi:hypothetical protein
MKQKQIHYVTCSLLISLCFSASTAASSSELQSGGSAGVRSIRLAQLESFAQLLQSMILANDTRAYLKLFSPDSSDEPAARNAIERKGDLYCVLFDTHCLRDAVGNLAKDTGEGVGAEILWRSRTIVSVRDILSDIRNRGRYKVNIGNESDPPNLDHGTIVWDIVPEDYGWMVRPRIETVYTAGQWRIASGIAVVPRVALSANEERWSIRQFKIADIVRQSRLGDLKQIGNSLREGILRAEPVSIQRVCRNFEVSVGEDQYMTCSEIAEQLDHRSSWLYCQIFETRCYRSNLETFAADPKNNAQELLRLSRKVVSVRDSLLKAGLKLYLEVSFDRPNGEEDFDAATIRFETPDPPESYGAMTYPHLSFVYSNDKWALSALFPAF